MSKKTIVDIKQEAFPFFGIDLPTEKTNEYLKTQSEQGYSLYSEQLVLNSEGGIQTYHHRKIVDVDASKEEKTETGSIYAG